MKRVIAFVLVLAICLPLVGCGSKLSKTLCDGEWMSGDRVCYFDNIGRVVSYYSLVFNEDGTCRETVDDYNAGVSKTEYHTYYWKVKGNEVILYDDSGKKNEAMRLKYEDGMLVGSAWYAKRFTYVQVGG